MSERRGESESAGTSPSGGPTMIDVTPIQGAEPEHKTEARTGSSSRAAVAISALATLVAALAASPYWAAPVASVLPWGSAPEAKPVLTDAALDARVRALEVKLGDPAQAQQRVAALDQRVGQLEQRPAPTPNPREAQQAAQQAQALGDRLSTIEQRIGTLAAAASSQTAVDATKGLQSEIQALSQKLDEQSQLLAKLQSQERGGADRADAALVVTLGQLRAALATSHPYTAELQAAEALAKDQSEIVEQLRTFDGRADRGVPNLAALTGRFSATAAEVDHAAAPPLESGWRGQLVGRVKRFFRIRRVADVSAKDPNDPDDALAASETALKLGDLAGAVAALRRLQGPAAEAAKQWLDDAQARLDADKTLAALDARLTSRILAAPTGAKP